jgi:hypothetical protein
MNKDFLLGNDWLEECIVRLQARAASEEEIIAYANAWELAVIKYACWMETEGFEFEHSVRILNKAMEVADFDLAAFPICTIH